MTKIANYVQKGDAIDYTNAGEADLAYGDVVNLTTRIGIANSHIPAGETGAIDVVGVYDLPKAAAAAISMGAAVYWDATNKNITATAEGNVPAGWAIAAAGADDTRARVKLG